MCVCNEIFKISLIEFDIKAVPWTKTPLFVDSVAHVWLLKGMAYKCDFPTVHWTGGVKKFDLHFKKYAD